MRGKFVTLEFYILFAAAVFFTFFFELFRFTAKVSRKSREIEDSAEHRFILNAIQSSGYVYSISKIPVEAKAYATRLVFAESTRFKILLGLAIFMFAPLSTGGDAGSFLVTLMICGILSIPFHMTRMQAEKYETHFSAIKKINKHNEESQSTASSPISEIARLKELLDKGVLSNAEFEQAKASLLRKIA